MAACELADALCRDPTPCGDRRPLALSGTYEALAILSTLAIAPLSLPLLPAVVVVGIVSMVLVAIAEAVEIAALVGSAMAFLIMQRALRRLDAQKKAARNRGQ